MYKKEKIHVVSLEMTDSCISGASRFGKFLKNGLQKDYSDKIVFHQILLINNHGILFPSINTNEECINVQIPIQKERIGLLKEKYWRTKFFHVIVDILCPHLDNKETIFVWHCQTPFLLGLAQILKANLGGKIILHIHAIFWKFKIEDNPSLFNFFYLKYEEKEFSVFNKENENEYGVCDCIICVSSCSKEFFENIYQIRKEKINIIFNGLSDITFNRLLDKEETLKFLFVGRICNGKGILNLLSALRKVKYQGYNFILNIAGFGHSTFIQNLKENYYDLNLNFLGQLPFEELQKLYSTCTIGIIPSLHEQCSYVAIEMAMFGVPMIVSDVDALSEMFEHEQTALMTPLVFDPDFGLNADEDKFVENIIRLIEDGELRKKLSKNVRIHYKKYFTLDRMIKETVAVYHQILGLPCQK